MTKTLLLFLCISSALYSQEKKKSSKTKKQNVYICNSTRSKAYHLRKNCKGLRRCKDTIIRVTLHKAKNYGRVRCGYEGGK